MVDDYARRIAAQETHVVEADGELVGLIVLENHPDHLLVDNVAVVPEAQGRGIGRLLLAVAAREARERGLPEVRLYTNAAMTENIAMYPQLGFEETHRVTEKGFQRVYFRKSCASGVQS
jgi:ribosomal protein S18 acetylase RimI-like enzyme